MAFSGTSFAEAIQATFSDMLFSVMWKSDLPVAKSVSAEL
jgi:hypothetical protein